MDLFNKLIDLLFRKGVLQHLENPPGYGPVIHTYVAVKGLIHTYLRTYVLTYLKSYIWYAYITFRGGIHFVGIYCISMPYMYVCTYLRMYELKYVHAYEHNNKLLLHVDSSVSTYVRTDMHYLCTYVHRYLYAFVEF